MQEAENRHRSRSNSRYSVTCLPSSEVRDFPPVLGQDEGPELPALNEKQASAIRIRIMNHIAPVNLAAESGG